jgi:hypothetical protein
VIARSQEVNDEVAACGRSDGLGGTVAYVGYAIAGATGVITVLSTIPPHDAFKTCVQKAFDEVRFLPFRKQEFKVTFPYKVP